MTATRVEVAIVGAGFAGLGMAIALRRAGREDFVLLERGASVGGTWRDNTYPGVACDVPSHLYGFAAHPNPDWSEVFATGPEIRRYLEDVAEREHLGERLHLQTPVLDARWDAQAPLWRIRTGGAQESFTADVLVLACGRLTEPSIPHVDGLESFPDPSSTRPAGITRPISPTRAWLSWARVPVRSRSCPSSLARRRMSRSSNAPRRGSCRAAAIPTRTPIAHGSQPPRRRSKR